MSSDDITRHGYPLTPERVVEWINDLISERNALRARVAELEREAYDVALLLDQARARVAGLETENALYQQNAEESARQFYASEARVAELEKAGEGK